MTLAVPILDRHHRRYQEQRCKTIEGGIDPRQERKVVTRHAEYRNTTTTTIGTIIETAMISFLNASLRGVSNTLLSISLSIVLK